MNTLKNNAIQDKRNHEILNIHDKFDEKIKRI